MFISFTPVVLLKALFLLPHSGESLLRVCNYSFIDENSMLHVCLTLGLMVRKRKADIL